MRIWIGLPVPSYQTYQTRSPKPLSRRFCRRLGGSLSCLADLRRLYSRESSGVGILGGPVRYRVENQHQLRVLQATAMDFPDSAAASKISKFNGVCNFMTNGYSYTEQQTNFSRRSPKRLEPNTSKLPGEGLLREDLAESATQDPSCCSIDIHEIATHHIRNIQTGCFAISPGTPTRGSESLSYQSSPGVIHP